MRVFVLLLILTGVLSEAGAQEKGGVMTFLNDTAGRQNKLMYVQWGYNVPLLTNFNSAGYGMQVAFGPNLAFPFSKKWTAGVFVGIKWSEFFNVIGKYDPEFSSDLNSSLQPNNGYEHDSVLVTYFAEQTGIRSQGGGATFMKVGLFFSYPKRYLPLVKFFRAFTSESVEGYLYDGVSTNDFIYLTSSNNYGCSASWTVLKFKNSMRLNIAGWFMRSKLQSLNLEEVWLHEFVNEDFAAKYSHVWRAGITVGIEFY
jgi:hypothetical protein